MVTKRKAVEREAQSAKRTRARAMRHDPKYCESLLWDALRDRKLDGFKFRRQHLIGTYTVDYLCVEKHLVIELDGGIHKLKQESDATRDAVLSVHGYRVLRIQNEELLRDLPNVLLSIRETLCGSNI